jgi:hypothetical protein
MERNIRRGNGVVHRSTDAEGVMPGPDCGGNRSAEGYRVVSADVTCKNCLKLMAAELARFEADGPMTGQYDDYNYAADLAATETPVNVVSYNGGKVHTMMPGMDEHPYPLCRGGGQNQNLTKFTTTTAPITCKTCLAYQERREAATTTQGETMTATAVETPAVAADAKVWEAVTHEGTKLVHCIPDGLHAVCDPEIMSIGGDRGSVAMVRTADLCTLCYAAVRSTTDTETKGNDMAAKTSDKLDVNTDAGKEAIAQIAANTERIATLRTEGKEESATELAAETDALVSRLSGRGVAGPKASARMGLTNAKKTPLPSAEVAVRAADTLDWHDAEGASDIVYAASATIANGLQITMKMSDLAKDIAREKIRVAARLTHKGGPDIMSKSQASRDASRDMYEGAFADLPRTFDTTTAIKKLMRSVQDQAKRARNEYIKSLDTDETEAALFTEAREAAPEGTSASDAVFAFYKIDKMSDYDKEKAAWELEEAKRAELEAAGGSEGDSEGDESGEGEGEGEGAEGGDDDTAEALAKAAEKLSKAGKLAEGAVKAAAKLDDDGRAKLKEGMNALIAALAAEAAKL